MGETRRGGSSLWRLTPLDTAGTGVVLLVVQGVLGAAGGVRRSFRWLTAKESSRGVAVLVGPSGRASVASAPGWRGEDCSSSGGRFGTMWAVSMVSTGEETSARSESVGARVAPVLSSCDDREAGCAEEGASAPEGLECGDVPGRSRSVWTQLDVGDVVIVELAETEG